MDVACPKCGDRVSVDPSQANDQGIVELRCGNCHKRLLLKITPRDLKLDSDTAPTRLPAAWAVVVRSLADEHHSALRTVLTQIPRFSRNPNKIPDLLGKLPYVFRGLSVEEARRMEACLDDCGSDFEIGAEVDLLDSGGTPEPPAAPEPATEANESDTSAPRGMLVLTVDEGPAVARFIGLVSSCKKVQCSGSETLEQQEAIVLDAHQAALERLEDEAQRASADGILGLRSTVSYRGTTLLVTLQGTAVQLAGGAV